MKKSVKKLISVALAAGMILSFSCSNSTGSANPEKVVEDAGNTTGVVGTENEDGTFTVFSWEAKDYKFTESTDGIEVSGVYGDVAVSGAKSKYDADQKACTYIQLTKNGSTAKGLKFVVPANTSKIILNTKCGSSGDGKTAKLTVSSITDGDWSATETLKNEDYANVTFTPSFNITTKENEEGETVAITQKTVVIYNSDSANSVNITSIKVIAPTEWTKTEDTVVSNKDTNTGDSYNEDDNSSTVTLPSLSGTVVSGSVNITKSEGWLNSAYIEFDPYTDAKGYVVKVDDVKIDDQLIRTYPSYVRADALGLTAGDHTMTVQAVLENGDTTQASSATMTVIDHDRSGYAFADGDTPGAYKADGTLKSGAVVIYVAESNVLTVSYNGKTGLQEILSESSLKTISNPLDIRVIGTITSNTFTSSYWGSTAEGLQIKNNKGPITIEGVGNDAGFHGFGMLVRNSDHVEIANLGFMCAKDDNISLDTDNQYSWVHNTDHFYGNAGGDSDQAKGDGTIDVKGKSSYQTYSYNHFWDSGKSSLCGMKSETADSRLTYHHNWFDHSDSRHPRIRTQTVHVYNNYFDGNSKYGVGVTYGASAFVEQNFFRNAHDPMMSSKQGTDATGDGTFSGENGGWIKAYNNKFTECNTNGVKFQYVTNKDTTDGDCDIDAYVVDNREDIVPSTYKTIAGGTTYNNFDTTESLYTTVEPTDPDTAKAMVVAYAGRHNADFTWTFDNTKDDAAYSVNTELKSAIVGYKSKLVSIQGLGSSSSEGGNTEGGSGSETDDGDTESGSGSESEGDSGTVISGDTLKFSSDTVGTKVTVGNVSVTATGNLKSGVTPKTYNNVTYETALKMESATKILITAEEDVSVTIISDTASKNIKIDDVKKSTDTNGVVTVSLSAGEHTISKGDSMNVYALIFN